MGKYRSMRQRKKGDAMVAMMRRAQTDGRNERMWAPVVEWVNGPLLEWQRRVWRSFTDEAQEAWQMKWSDEWLQDRFIRIHLAGSKVEVTGTLRRIIYDAEGHWRNVWMEIEDENHMVMILADQIVYLETLQEVKGE